MHQHCSNQVFMTKYLDDHPRFVANLFGSSTLPEFTKAEKIGVDNFKNEVPEMYWQPLVPRLVLIQSGSPVCPLA